MELRPLLPRKLAKIVSKSTKLLSLVSNAGEFVFVQALDAQKQSTLASIHALDRAALLLLFAAQCKDNLTDTTNLELLVADTSAHVCTGISLWFNAGQALAKKGFHMNRLALNCINIIFGYTETSQSLSDGVSIVRNDIYSQISWLELSYALACFIAIQRATIADKHKPSLRIKWDSTILDTQRTNIAINTDHSNISQQLQACIYALAPTANEMGIPINYKVKITEKVERVVEVEASVGLIGPQVFRELFTSNKTQFGILTPGQVMPKCVSNEKFTDNEGEMLRYICLYRRYQSASYGRSFLHYSGLASTILGHHEHAAFAEYVGLTTEDIIASSYSSGYSMYRFSSSPLIYFISVDNANKFLVVSLRGTFDLQDVLTDAMCHFSKFMWNGSEYKAHCGMLRSARLVLKSNLITQLRDALEIYEDYSLVILGHSLGAGVASIVSMLISEKSNSRFVTTRDCGLPPGRSVKCIAYAPPATVCGELSDAVEGLVVSVIYEDDVVPHLSLGVLWDLKAITLELQNHRHKLVTLLKYISEPNKNIEYLDYFVEKLRQKMVNEKLMPPGVIYRIDSQDPLVEPLTIPTRVIISQVTNKRMYFNEPIFSRKMLYHTSNYYERSLDILAKVYEGLENV